MARFLFITPNDLGMPRLIAPVSQALQNRCPSRHTTKELHDTTADRPNVNAELPVDVVFYFGHGKRDYLGSTGNSLLDSANEKDVVQILVAIACLAGAGLGNTYFQPSTSRAFIGFDTYLFHPAKVAGRANDAYETALVNLLTGSSVDTVSNALDGEFRQAANDYITKRGSYGLTDAEALVVFFGLRSNILAKVCLGDQKRSV
jgi:hypothetical protein